MPILSKILIAPLDWGLGHTTRCFPIVKTFLDYGVAVYMAASGASATLIADNFPQVTILPLSGYGITYSKKKHFFAAKIVGQIPKIFKAIRHENKWLRQQQEKYHFDAIISDNRYGLYLKDVPSVIMTHQLQIQSGMGNWVDLHLQKWHYRLLAKFTECWIVDDEQGGISGILGHPDKKPDHIFYMGILSQFMLYNTVPVKEKKDQILLLLSGPEPMRSLFEQKILEQARTLTQYNFILVAGTPSSVRSEDLPEHIVYIPYLNAAGLMPLLQESALVVCRSGYSTVMDLCFFGKNAVLVPTPGQSEQEYLASYLQKSGAFSNVAQHELHLQNVLTEKVTSEPFHVKKGSYADIQTFIDAFLKRHAYSY